MEKSDGPSYSEVDSKISDIEVTISCLEKKMEGLDDLDRTLYLVLHAEKCLHLKSVQQLREQQSLVLGRVDLPPPVQDGIHPPSFRAGVKEAQLQFKRKKLRYHKIFKTRGCMLCGKKAKSMQTAHVFALQWYSPDRSDFEEIRQLLHGWKNLRIWRSMVGLKDPANLVRMCRNHHADFDAHMFTICYDFTKSALQFVSLFPKNSPVLERYIVKANAMLRTDNGKNQYSWLSRRCVAFRYKRATEMANQLFGTSYDPLEMDTVQELSYRDSEGGDAEEEERVDDADLVTATATSSMTAGTAGTEVDKKARAKPFACIPCIRRS